MRSLRVAGRGVNAGQRRTLSVVGEVIAALPNAMFRVRLDSGHELVAHVPAATRLAIIRILPGDRVRVEVSPLDRSRGRITERLPAK